jgi:hypothetical protein
MFLLPAQHAGFCHIYEEAEMGLQCDQLAIQKHCIFLFVQFFDHFNS